LISTFLLGQGGKKVTLIILEKKKFHLLCVFFFKEILCGMVQKRVCEGQYSKKMLSTINLLIFNTLMDGFMHA
jgi:hypothetical protein